MAFRKSKYIWIVLTSWFLLRSTAMQAAESIGDPFDYAAMFEKQSRKNLFPGLIDEDFSIFKEGDIYSILYYLNDIVKKTEATSIRDIKIVIVGRSAVLVGIIAKLLGFSVVHIPGSGLGSALRPAEQAKTKYTTYQNLVAEVIDSLIVPCGKIVLVDYASSGRAIVNFGSMVAKTYATKEVSVKFFAYAIPRRDLDKAGFNSLVNDYNLSVPEKKLITFLLGTREPLERDKNFLESLANELYQDLSPVFNEKDFGPFMISQLSQEEMIRKFSELMRQNYRRYNLAVLVTYAVLFDKSFNVYLDRGAENPSNRYYDSKNFFVTQRSLMNDLLKASKRPLIEGRVDGSNLPCGLIVGAIGGL